MTAIFASEEAVKIFSPGDIEAEKLFKIEGNLDGSLSVCKACSEIKHGQILKLDIVKQVEQMLVAAVQEKLSLRSPVPRHG